METKIQKWGNSLGVRLPKDLAQKTGISEGTIVTVSLSKKGLLVFKQPKQEVTLDDLLKSINKSNLPNEVNWGDRVGKEIW